jgi:anti-sigma factor RsiW
MSVEDANMIDCQMVRERLGRFLDGELPRQESSMVRAHIERCPGCQQELRDLQVVSTNLNALSVPPVPDGAADLIMACVRHLQVGPARSWGIFEFWKPWPAAMRLATAGTVVTACLVGLTLGSATSAAGNRTPSEMAWVGLASGATITSAYLETAR